MRYTTSIHYHSFPNYHGPNFNILGPGGYVKMDDIPEHLRKWIDMRDDRNIACFFRKDIAERVAYVLTILAEAEGNV